MYESTQVKWTPATGWRCVVELVNISNVNDGFYNVNYSGISILLTGTRHTKDHVDLILIASKECQRYITPTRPRIEIERISGVESVNVIKSFWMEETWAHITIHRWLSHPKLLHVVNEGTFMCYIRTKNNYMRNNFTHPVRCSSF